MSGDPFGRTPYEQLAALVTAHVRRTGEFEVSAADYGRVDVDRDTLETVFYPDRDVYVIRPLRRTYPPPVYPEIFVAGSTVEVVGRMGKAGPPTGTVARVEEAGPYMMDISVEDPEHPDEDMHRLWWTVDRLAVVRLDPDPSMISAVFERLMYEREELVT